ncbi:MAG TPA: hypothetical protein PLG90_12570 [Ignavibacteria bacterium]|nr:hypothetical protein [Ignavibacteria bacterium]
MYKFIFEKTEGVDFYGIFALSTFFIFFIVMVIWMIKVKKDYISKMENLPLEENNDELLNFKNGKNNI